MPHCRSPSCAPAVASAPPRSMGGSPCSPTPAASSKPTTDIASPTTDPGTSDNHIETAVNARLPSSRSRSHYSLREPEWELQAVSSYLRRQAATGSIAIHHILWFGPCRATLPSQRLDLDGGAAPARQITPELAAPQLPRPQAHQTT